MDSSGKKLKGEVFTKFLRSSPASAKVVTMSLYDKQKPITSPTSKERPSSKREKAETVNASQSPKEEKKGSPHSAFSKKDVGAMRSSPKAVISPPPKQEPIPVNPPPTTEPIPVNPIPKFEPIAVDDNLLQESALDKDQLQQALLKTPQLQSLELITTKTDSELISELKKQIADSSKSHEELHTNITNTNSDVEKKLLAIEKEKEEQKTQILNLIQSIKDKDSHIAKLEVENETYKKQVLTIQIGQTLEQIKLEANQPKLFASLNNEIEALKNEKEELQTNYTQNLTAINKEREEYIKTIKNHSARISELQALYNEAKAKVEKLEVAKSALTEENKIHLRDLQGKSEQITLLENQIKGMERSSEKLKEYAEKITSMLKQFAELSKKASELTEKLKFNLDEALTKIKAQDTKIIELSNSLSKSNAEISQLRRSVQVTESSNQQNKLAIEKLKDQLQELNDMKARAILIDSSNNSLRTDIDKVVSEYNKLNIDFNSLKTKSEKLWRDNGVLIQKYNNILVENRKLNQQTKEAYEESDNLRNKLSLLRLKFEESQRYQPALDDAVDIKLAELINSRLDQHMPIEVPFIRQGKGVYTFGTLKILVKIEMDSLIVRVGGGFTHFEDFLKIQTPIELDKIKRSEINKGVNMKSAIIKKSLNMLDEEGIVSPKGSPSH